MNRRGVCYDVGRVMMGQSWRPVFDTGEMHRELEIIKEDLHCNAVRICGQDIDRLTTVGRDALEQGLEVWLSPELWDHSPEETLEYVVEAARQAEELRRGGRGQVVFSVGTELTLFMRGILEGDTFIERFRHPSFEEKIRPVSTTLRSTRSWRGRTMPCARCSRATSPTRPYRSRASTGVGSTS
jgi:hypothetical protein